MMGDRGLGIHTEILEGDPCDSCSWTEVPHVVGHILCVAVENIANGTICDVRICAHCGRAKVMAHREVE